MPCYRRPVLRYQKHQAKDEDTVHQVTRAGLKAGELRMPTRVHMRGYWRPQDWAVDKTGDLSGGKGPPDLDQPFEDDINISSMSRQ